MLGADELGAKRPLKMRTHIGVSNKQAVDRPRLLVDQVI